MNLSDVKIGDLLIVTLGSFNRCQQIEHVTKITKTQVATNKNRYMKANGRRLGSGSEGWYASYAHIPKEGEVERVREENFRKKLISYLKRFDWNKVDTECLRKINSLLTENTD